MRRMHFGLCFSLLACIVGCDPARVEPKPGDKVTVGNVGLLFGDAFPSDETVLVAFKNVAFEHSCKVDDMHAPATRRATMTLGDDLDVSFFYSIAEGKTTVQKITLAKERDVHYDLDGNGRFDLSSIYSKTYETRVMMDGCWQKVGRTEDWDIFEHVLEDGRRVQFNRKTGSWDEKDKGDAGVGS